MLTYLGLGFRALAFGVLEFLGLGLRVGLRSTCNPRLISYIAFYGIYVLVGGHVLLGCRYLG